MTAEAANVERLREAVERVSAQGFESILEFLDPEIEVVDLPQVPEERERHGRAQVAAWFAAMAEVWDEVRIEAEEIVEIDTGTLLVVFRFLGHARRSGIEVDQRVASAFTIRDGRAVRWRNYASREEALADVTGVP